MTTVLLVIAGIAGTVFIGFIPFMLFTGIAMAMKDAKDELE